MMVIVFCVSQEKRDRIRFQSTLLNYNFLTQIVLSSILAHVAVQGQYHSDPRTAQILNEQRYLSGDGKFGAAYTQDDGTDFKEETDADGTRHGRYAYIDPTGQKRTVTYTAGKNG